MPNLPVMGSVWSYPVDERFYPNEQVRGYRVLASLNGEWHDEEHKAFQVPFSTDEYRKMVLTKDFLLTQQPQDTLILYFEGLSNMVDIYLNDKLLYIGANRAVPHIIKVPPKLFNNQWNELRVVLYRKGSNLVYDEANFVGIYRPAYLLIPSYNSEKVPFLFPKVATGIADTCFILATWHPLYGYNIPNENVRIVLRQLTGDLKRFPIYLPYGATAKLYKLLAEEQIVITNQPGKYVGLLFNYPLSTANSEQLPVWFTDNGVKYTGFNSFFSPKVPVFFTMSRLFMLMIGLLVLGLLVVWKNLDERSYLNIVTNLFNLRKKNEFINSGNWIRGSLLGVVSTIRVIILAAAIFFFIGYLRSESDLQAWLNLLSDRSAATSVIDFTKNLDFLLFLVVLLWLLVLNIFRWFILSFFSVIYGLKDLPTRMANLDLLAAFPVVLYWGLGTFLLNISTGGLAYIVLIPSLMMLCLYWFIRYRLIFNAMTQSMRIPLLFIILYICSLEILPWMLVL